jgi:hypothetical protein
LSAVALLGLVVAALAAAAVLGPKIAMRRAQDRLARTRLASGTDSIDLLTRADLVVGRYRRVPGVLGLSTDTVFFEGLFAESVVVATSRIAKIVTGRRMASGRTLFFLEIIRITQTSGEESEFVVTHAAAEAWRSHLGLWAAKERQTHAERVMPAKELSAVGVMA